MSTMRVLICDDDASTRFVIKRVLAQAPGCRVSECADGLEALELVSAGHVDLLILDIQMPTLDGLEVLDALRRSAKFKTLPVIVLTSERRKEMVTKLVELGIFGYVLKPLRSERLMPLIDRARATFSTDGSDRRRVNVDGIRLSADTPAMLVDGNAEYRELFKSHADQFGTVLVASSGIEALALFKRTQVNLVFVGSQLGVISSDVLIPKMRALAGGQPLTIVAIREQTDAAGLPQGVDEAIARTSDIAAHREDMRRFIRLAGPLDGISSLVGSVNEALTTTATQVFGMMLDSEVVPTSIDEYQSELHATVDIDIQTRYRLTVDVHLSIYDARRIAARKLSIEREAVSEEDMAESTSALATLVGGRLHAVMDEQHIANTCSPARFEEHAPRRLAAPVDTHGMQLRFKATAVGATFVLVVHVAEKEQHVQSAPQHAA